MKSFKQILAEMRNKNDPHEKTIRALASLGRMDYMRQFHNDEYETHRNKEEFPDSKKGITQRSYYGDCDRISHCVANRLRHTYPSVKVVYSHKFGHPLKDDPDGSQGLTGHSWVEIPETGHFVDSSHDMFRIDNNRKTIPTKGGMFPQTAIKIGKRNSSEYRKRYGGIHIKKQTDPNWRPGKKLGDL